MLHQTAGLWLGSRMAGNGSERDILAVAAFTIPYRIIFALVSSVTAMIELLRNCGFKTM
jgi:hypothetical protein